MNPVDEMVATGNATQPTEIEKLRAEVHNFKTWGIIEIAVRNHNVSSYMDHWERRATTAEAERDALRKVLGEEGLTVNYQIDEITKQRDAAEAENAVLRSALEPFSGRAERYDQSHIDDEDAAICSVADLRRARAAIGGEQV